MGVICPCGVIVNAFSEDNNVKFEGQNGTVKGSLLYRGNICVTTLGDSELSLVFEGATSNENNFLFTVNEFTSVVCKREGENCVVTVTGTGLVGTQEFAFTAVFRDQVSTANVDIVQSFVITGFFDQNGAAPVAQGSIVAVGCQELA